MLMYIIIQIDSMPISKSNCEQQVYIKKINQLTKSHNETFLLKAKQQLYCTSSSL